MLVNYFLIMASVLWLGLFAPSVVTAQTSEPVMSLTPDRFEFVLEPGETARPVITVNNNTAEPLQFKVEVEDFGPTKDLVSVIRLYGLEAGPSSLKNYVIVAPEYEQFILSPGERLAIPVTITLPNNLAPGGLYGAIVVGAMKLGEDHAQAKVMTRLGSLLFVRVAGAVYESGELKEFGLIRDREEQKLRFQLLFENQGDIYLNPYGLVTVYDWFGKAVGWQEIKPWFVLPHSFRRQEVWLSAEWPAGYYRAVVTLNRGYADQIDEQSLGFWLWPASGWLGLGLIGGSLVLGRWWLGRSLT